MRTDPARSRARKARRVEKAAESQALVSLGGIPLLYDVRLPDGTELKATRIAPKSPQDSLQGRLASSFVAWAIRKPKRPRKAKRRRWRRRRTRLKPTRKALASWVGNGGQSVRRIRNIRKPWPSSRARAVKAQPKAVKRWRLRKDINTA